MSPTLAVKSLGEKLSPLFPTWTVWTEELPEDVVVAADADADVDVLEPESP